MMEVKKLSLIELKALVYDEIVKMENLQTEIAAIQKKIQDINQQIQKLKLEGIQ